MKLMQRMRLPNQSVILNSRCPGGATVSAAEALKVAQAAGISVAGETAPRMVRRNQ